MASLHHWRGVIGLFFVFVSMFLFLFHFRAVVLFAFSFGRAVTTLTYSTVHYTRGWAGLGGSLMLHVLYDYVCTYLPTYRPTDDISLTVRNKR